METVATQPTITLSVSTSVTQGGTVDIPVSLDGGNIVIHKLFTFQISFKGQTGAAGSSAQWYSGNKITGTSTTATAFSGSGITNAQVGDMYLNTDTMNTYRCTVGGAASAAKWVYVGNIKGQTGDIGPGAIWYTGTKITGTSTTATVFSGSGITAAKVGDMYLNTSTYNTYRCTVGGAASAAKWVYVGNIKGQTGDIGPGAIWYTGTKITGTSTTATVFSGSGITAANVGDMYLNTSTYNTYRCTVAGAASAAKWVYVNNIKGGKGDQGDPGADAITMTVTSSNGTIFKNTAVVTTLTAHVYKAGTELNATQIAALGTIKWYKDGSTTALSTTGPTLNISSGDVTNKATYIAQLEG